MDRCANTEALDQYLEQVRVETNAFEDFRQILYESIEEHIDAAKERFNQLNTQYGYDLDFDEFIREEF